MSYCCCCCPPAVSALFTLWVQSGFSKGVVAGALTFFPPEPPLYKFERVDADGNPVPPPADEDDASDKSKSNSNSRTANNNNNNNKGKKDRMGRDQPPEEPADQRIADGSYEPIEGEAVDAMNSSPAQEFTQRAKQLRERATARNARDSKDALAKVEYKLILDPRLSAPRLEGGVVTAVKIATQPFKPNKRNRTEHSPPAHVAAILYQVPPDVATEETRTIIYSHGNATDIGAMYPLQAILAHSLGCHVVSYDYSGYGESGGVPMEDNTYSDIAAVYDYVLAHKGLANGTASRIILYGQSVGSGPCCHLAMQRTVGGMILHSPFMSGMRVLTPSRILGCLDIYPNIDRVGKAKCPVMVIHGRLDEEVEVAHGIAMHQAVPNHLKREPWWVPDRGHNDITEGPGKLGEYIRRLRNFLGTLDGYGGEQGPAGE